MWSGPDDPDPERRAARIQDQAARIVRLRLKADGITQAQFAESIGMDRPKVSRLLTGAMWASLIDLEILLGGCGATLTSISLAIGDGSHQSTRVKKIISSYLREQLAKVEEENAHIEPERPST
ncbi:helix-turn-helix domain-containing protein [Microbacterium sp. 22215]